MVIRLFFQILSRDQGKQPSEKNIDQVTLTQNDNPDADKARAIETEQEHSVLISGQRNLQDTSAEGKPQPTACVVGLSSKTGDTMLATWTPFPALTNHKSQWNIFFIPMDKGIPTIRVHIQKV